MSRFLRNAAVAALTVAAFGAIAGAASAQSYNRLVVFGDSLSDNGNLFAATGNTQPTSPPYFQGRFSNGPTFVELLGFNLGRSAVGAPVTGSIDYAYGGARTDSQAFPPGMRNQLLAYTGANGVFGANDLVSVLGGANNIFQGFGAASVSSNPTGAVSALGASAAADLNFIINDIAARGAGTILVTNLPRLGVTPQFSATGPNGAALADFAGQSFNGSLFAGLVTVAASKPNTNIIYFDLYKVSDALIANPGRFGLSNVTASCFNGVTVCSNPDSYLYWDGVHPTAAGHRLIAALANDYLYYGDRGAQSAVQGETAFRQREDMLDMTSEGLSGRGGWNEGAQLTFAVIGDSATTDARGVVAESKAEGWGVRAGLDAVMSGSWRAGVAASWRTADVNAGPMSFNLDTYGFDAWLGWRSGDMFLNASAGGAIDKYDDIERVSALAAITQFGETDGGSVGARVQGGLWIDMGGIALSPRAALSYVSTEVNGYSETGAAATYRYADRTVAGVSGEVSLRAEGGGDGLSFYVEGGYRDSLTDNTDDVRTDIEGNTAHVLARTVDDPFGGSALASAGVETHLGPVKVALAYHGRFGDSADSHVGGISFSLPIQ